MPRQSVVFKVLVAGPGDVTRERNAVADAINAWTRRHGDRTGVVLQAIGWEQARPDLSTDPQASINRQLGKDRDAVIAVFGKRIGTATPRAISGTVEEIEEAIADGKDVMVYFSSGPIRREGLDLQQLELLEEFRRSLRGRGLLGSYSSLKDLERQLDDHVTRLGYEFESRGQSNFDRPRNLTEDDHDVLSHLVGRIANNSQTLQSAMAVSRLAEKNRFYYQAVPNEGAPLSPEDRTIYIHNRDFIPTLIHQGLLVESSQRPRWEHKWCTQWMRHCLGPTASSRHGDQTRRRVPNDWRPSEDAAQLTLQEKRTRQTVGNFLSWWLAGVVKPTKAGTTHELYEITARLQITPGLGRVELGRLTPQGVQALLRKKGREGLSPRSVAIVRVVLRTALNHTVRRGAVERTVAALVEVPR
jgi:hypothetical protein